MKPSTAACCSPPSDWSALGRTVTPQSMPARAETRRSTHVMSVGLALSISWKIQCRRWVSPCRALSKIACASLIESPFSGFVFSSQAVPASLLIRFVAI